MPDIYSRDAPFIREVRLLPERVPSPDKYPFYLPFIRNLDPLNLESSVVFLVGENGSGKSTLLEALATAWGFNAEGGSRDFNFSTRASHSEEFANALRIVKGVRRPLDGFFLRAESFFNVATQIEELDVLPGYGGRSLHEQSHGEAFYALFTERFSGNGLYMLDEPEAALSLGKQLKFLIRMRELIQLRSQFIIATHSPILMAYPEALILEFSENGVKQVSYDEVEQIGLWRHFLRDPAAAMRQLLSEE